MAQTKKKRRKKRRGTQGGRVDTSGRTSRPRSREEARARARSQTGKKKTAARVDKPPTWGSALRKALIFSALLAGFVYLLGDRTPAQAVALGLFMLTFYVPLGYYTDRFFWRRRERQRQEALKAKKAGRARGRG